ncbi:MAG: hypothetical protein Q9205_003924 [Flavoplaca limonia]
MAREQWGTFQDDAQEVATLLQSHPLALIQAGAYISRAHCTIAEYPGVFDRQRKRLLKFRPKQAQSRYGDVFTTFEASAALLQVSQEEVAKDALQLLSMLGICAASRLPLQRLFEEGWKGAQAVPSYTSSNKDHFGDLDTWHVSHLPTLLEADADVWDPFRLVEAVQLLKSFSLVSADTHDDLLNVSMHPLTNAWALDRLDAEAQHNAWLATGCLVAVSNYRYTLGEEMGRQLQPHLGVLASLDMNLMFASKPPGKITRIIKECGWLLCTMRDDMKLKDLMDRLLLYLNLDPLFVDEKWQHVYNLYAQNLKDCGKAKEAVALLEQVVLIREQKLAEFHPDRLSSQHQLAMTYLDNGQIERALSLLEQVTLIQEQTLAENHLDRLASQHVLSRAYMENGQIEKALSLLEQVVQIVEQTLAENHPARLASQHVLARAYMENGQIEKALSLLEQVVQIEEQTLAENHPDRLTSLDVLAYAYRANGQVEKAVSLLEPVVQIEEQILAKDHPDRLISQFNLAVYLRQLKRRDAALQMLKHVVEVERQVFDETHPDRIRSEKWLKVFEDEMVEAGSANYTVIESDGFWEYSENEIVETESAEMSKRRTKSR